MSTDTSTESRKLIRALREHGYKPRAYSGRGMFGKECVGVTSDGYHLDDLLDEVRADMPDLPSPSTDQLGMGIIAYWRHLPWPEKA